jgi:hypothetical protein
MACTLADIADQIAGSYGSGGLCITSQEDMDNLRTALNEAIPLLMKRLDAKGTVSSWTVPVHGGIIALPHDCLEVRQAFLNGCAVELRDEWYEGQIGFQGGCTGQQCGPRDLRDLGDGFAIPFEWPNHHFDSRLGLVAEHDADAGTKVQVRVRDRYGNEIEEFLELPSDQQMVQTESVVTDVKFLRKGATKGGVRAYVAYSTGERTMAARYQPRVQVASFRKKRLPWAGCSGELTILGVMRFLPLVSEFDPLPICDTAALGFALQAIESKKNRDYQNYNAALQLATNELLKELSSEQSAGVTSQMQVRGPFGRSVGRRRWM